MTGYDDSHADLLNSVSGNYQYLSDSSGLLTTYDYYSSTTAFSSMVLPHFRQISAMDVVRSLNQANVILPAGDVQIGNLDYNIYSNAQFNLKDASQYPVKMNGENPVLMSDIGQLKDAHALQYNVVHVNGQRSVYLPVMKQGGDSNTIAPSSEIAGTLPWG